MDGLELLREDEGLWIIFSDIHTTHSFVDLFVLFNECRSLNLNKEISGRALKRRESLRGYSVHISAQSI